MCRSEWDAGVKNRIAFWGVTCALSWKNFQAVDAGHIDVEYEKVVTYGRKWLNDINSVT